MPTAAVVLVKRTRRASRPSIKPSNWTAALTNPFQESAYGCRIPDPYSLPTAVYNLHGTSTVSTSSSINYGSLLLLPHPLVSFVDLNGTIDATTSAIIGSNMVLYSANQSWRGACGQGSLASITPTYRVVSCGWKVRCVTAPLARTGKVIFAPIPIHGNLPSIGLLNSYPITATQAYSDYFGCSNVQLASSSILSLPGAFEMSLEDFAVEDVLLRDKPISPDYFTFHTAANSSYVNNSLGVQESTGVVGIGTATVGYLEDTTASGGHLGWVVYYSGCPFSAPVFEIEHIYHLEGLPAIATTGYATPTPSGLSSAHSSPSMFAQAMDMVSKLSNHAFTKAGTEYLLSQLAGRTRRMRLSDA